METLKIITTEKYVLYLILALFFGILFTIYYIFMNSKKIFSNTTKETIIYILMMLAEKYISTKGITKMKFCIDMVKTFLNKVNTIHKITIPSDEEIEVELQKVFDKYHNEIQGIKSIANNISSKTMEKHINDIIS